jgi:hypothetical protein
MITRREAVLALFTGALVCSTALTAGCAVVPELGQDAKTFLREGEKLFPANRCEESITEFRSWLLATRRTGAAGCGCAVPKPCVCLSATPLTLAAGHSSCHRKARRL